MTTLNYYYVIPTDKLGDRFIGLQAAVHRAQINAHAGLGPHTVVEFVVEVDEPYPIETPESDLRDRYRV